MSARLVIHAEIDTVDDLIEVNGLALQKFATNPFDLARLGQYFVGVAHGITKQTEEPKPEPVAEGATS